MLKLDLNDRAYETLKKNPDHSLMIKKKKKRNQKKQIRK